MLFLKKVIILLLFHVNHIKCYSCSIVIKSKLCLIKNTIINDNKMPILYTNNINLIIPKNNFLTAEHIYPQSLLKDCENKDMHNIIKKFNKLNVNRSNYKYCDIYDLTDKNWFKLEYDNYVNHKKKLFIPNINSRGFISRAILYMCREYNLDFNNIIDKSTLIRWFYKYSPTTCELYHNDVVRNIQNKNNIFISSYNKKNSYIKRYIENL